MAYNNYMKKITKIVIGILILGGLTGGYFGMRYQIKLYNTIVIQNKKIGIINDFLSYTFPTEINQYMEVLREKNISPVSLPANKPATK